jgi:Tfp pilus assembly ATPase PilU
MVKDKHQDIIDLMIKQEELISELYLSFGKTFPEHHEFWETLSEEEKMHAKILTKLKALIKQETVVFDDERIKSNTLQTFTEYLETLILKSESSAMHIRQALVLSHDIEMTIIEKNVFTLFKSDSIKITESLEKLISDTKDHSKRILDMIKQIS